MDMLSSRPSTNESADRPGLSAQALQETRVDIDRSLPSCLVALGRDAFPVLLADDRVVIAASRYGRGRLVHFGHEAFLTGSAGCTGWDSVLRPCLDWALRLPLADERSDGNGNGAEISIGTDASLDESHAFAVERFKLMRLSRSDLSINRCRVFLTLSYSDADAERLVSFVASGGCVLSGGQAWHWSYSNAGKSALRHYPGNAWLCPMGLGVTADVAEGCDRLRPADSDAPGLVTMLTDGVGATDALKFAGDRVFVSDTIGLAGFEAAWEALLTTRVSSGHFKAWIDVLRSQQRSDRTILLGQAPSLTDARPGGHLASALLAHGRYAFPVFVSESGCPVVVATRFGRGRVVQFGHEAYLDGCHGLEALLLGCLDWSRGCGDASDGDVVVIGTDLDLAEGHAFKRLDGFKLMRLSRSDLSIARCCVFLTLSYSDADAERLVSFVASGGCVLSGGQAWHWSYSNAGKSALRHYPGNAWLCPMGLGVTADVAEGCDRLRPADSDAPGLVTMLTDGVGATDALKFAGDRVFVSDTIGLAGFEAAWQALRSRSKAADKDRLDQGLWLAPLLLREHASSPSGTLLYRSPLAELFPGDVVGLTDAEAVSVSPIDAVIDASYSGLHGSFMYSAPEAPVWRATGAYAPPGRLVVLEAPMSIAKKGLQMLIGCHTDLVPAGKARPPRIHIQFPIEDSITKGFNVYGGIVYVLIPPGSSLGKQEIRLQGCVRYPLYRLSGDEDEDAACAEAAEAQSVDSLCLSDLRTTRAPMFELCVPGQLVISAPTDIGRRWLLAPGPIGLRRLALLWRRVMRAINEFHWVSVVSSGERPREERIVLDKAISAGSMHSGYPIMGYLEYDECLLSADKMTSRGSWGPVHELCHNHQWRQREFTGTVEASNNVPNVFVHETVLGIPRSSIPDIAPELRLSRRQAYLAGGKSFSTEWNVWLALDTFLQLQEAFGWEPFKALNCQYRDNANSQEVDGGDNQTKIDTYVKLFSRQVSLDLTPFFEAWGVPVSTSATAALIDLPKWTDHPLAGIKQ